MTRLAIWLFAPNLAEKVEGLQMQQYVSWTSPHFQTTANIFSSGIGQAPTAYVGNEKAKAMKLIQESEVEFVTPVTHGGSVKFLPVV